MARRTSIGSSANYFKKCVKTYLASVGKEKYNNDDDFWELVSSITFENEKISHKCPLFIAMKSYADTHAMSKSALVWQVNFENASERYIKEIILYLIDQKEDQQKWHQTTKNNDYSAAMDNFNNNLRQIKFKMKANGVPAEIIEQFDITKTEWQDIIKSEIDDYKQFDEPLDDNFNKFLESTKEEVKKTVSQLTDGIMYPKYKSKTIKGE